MRIVVPVEIDMTDEQVDDYADYAGISIKRPGRRPYAKDVVASVRAFACEQVRRGFDNVGSGAQVSIKER